MLLTVLLEVSLNKSFPKQCMTVLKLEMAEAELPLGRGIHVMMTTPYSLSRNAESITSSYLSYVSVFAIGSHQKLG